MESSPPQTIIAKKLLHLFRVVYCMLRKGISKSKLMMELHLLFKRGKLVGKAVSNLMTLHHHHHDRQQSFSSAYSSFSCRSTDPNLSFYNPGLQEVEFSCINTPSYPSFISSTRKNHHHHHGKNYGSYDYEAITAFARAFEMLNKNSGSNNCSPNNEYFNASSHMDQGSVTPSPLLAAGLIGRSTPATVRQLRITDSPFPVVEGVANDGRVDREAEEFISRFYEQLRMQQSGATKGIRRRG